jgi:hypothetical protein
VVTADTVYAGFPGDDGNRSSIDFEAGKVNACFFGRKAEFGEFSKDGFSIPLL